MIMKVLELVSPQVNWGYAFGAGSGRFGSGAVVVVCLVVVVVASDNRSASRAASLFY